MNYRNLGRSGLKVSELSFGSWVTFAHQIQDDVSKNLMALAYDSGINFFDNAEAYASGRSELAMGKFLKAFNWERSTYVVSSKVFWGGKLPNQIGLSRKHIFEACHKALKRLQVDYLDLFFCHRPDPETPIEETVRAMTDLVRQGKVLYWGTSEWPATAILEAYRIAYAHHLEPPVMEQPQYNLFHRHRVEEEYDLLYKNCGLGTTIWSPLASGLLTGKYNEGVPTDSRLNAKGMEWLEKSMLGEEKEQRLAKIKALAEVANDLGTSLAALSIAWCLKNPNVSTVILGASKVEQLEQNLKAIDVVEKLDENIMKTIAAIFSS